MSKTGDLGKVEEVQARPAPKPPPKPAFKILRPAWLQETMKVSEEYDGTMVRLGFDPRPDSAPHDVVILTEQPRRTKPRGGIHDPQASTRPPATSWPQ